MAHSILQNQRLPQANKRCPSSAKGKITSFLPASNVVSASGAENPYHRSYKRCNCGWHDGTSTSHHRPLRRNSNLPPPRMTSPKSASPSISPKSQIREKILLMSEASRGRRSSRTTQGRRRGKMQYIRWRCLHMSLVNAPSVVALQLLTIALMRA